MSDKQLCRKHNGHMSSLGSGLIGKAILQCTGSNPVSPIGAGRHSSNAFDRVIVKTIGENYSGSGVMPLGLFLGPSHNGSAQM